ncbi:MAG: ABC transporter substrate-binding protein, partial [Thermoplasmata archaeon]
LLPGNYYETNTFWNITQNMTVNNKTNSITFHFQEPMSPTLVYEILAASGDFVMDANWIASHATSAQPALQWTPAGFAAYEAQGSESDYNTYFVNHIMADGPYEIDFIVPSSEVVLIANPNFHEPGPWYPAPKIQKVVIEYIGETSTRDLQLKSGYAQMGGIPSSDFDLVQALNTSRIDYNTFFPTLSIYWYNFNANINTTILNTEYKGSNVPQTLFTVLQIRQAFAYAYNESEYLNYDIGNILYHKTFASSYVGMLPLGMYGYQNESVINASTNGAVPYFDMAKATTLFEKGVDAFNNASTAAKSGITIGGVPGAYTYNGAPLDIPIFIFSADPSDLAGAEQWGTYLHTITGGTFPVEPTAFPILLGNQVQGENPMPIYELGWAPDYPYPTDYLNPMANPVNTTTYPGPNDMTSWWFSANSTNPTPNGTESHDLALMAEWYVNGSTASSTSVALHYFHMMNDMLVNMTFYVYLFQSYVYTTMTYKVPLSVVRNYEGNLMWAAGAGDTLYNYLYYSSTPQTFS